MSTEYWALVVSVIALIASIGIPIWQSRATNALTIAGKRNLLLQGILSAKSVTYGSMWEYRRVLNQLGDKIKPEQRAMITDAMARMQELHDDLEALHEKLSDRNDRTRLRELERVLSHVNVMSADAKDMAKLTENFVKDSLQIIGS